MKLNFVEPTEEIEEAKVEGLPGIDLGELDEYLNPPPADLEGFDPNQFGDVEGVLSIHTADLLDQAAHIHGLVRSWTQAVADLKAAMLRVNVARDLQFANARHRARRHLELDISKPTKEMVETRAAFDKDYLRLCYAAIDSQHAHELGKGTLQALLIKASLAKAMLFAIGEDAKIAVRHATSLDYE
jgi:hypothetical protein